MPYKPKAKFETTTIVVDFDNREFRTRILKLLAFLEKHSQDGISDYMSAGDIECYILGTFGQEEPENEIQIGKERN
jgi:hypothetical protein